MNEYIEYMGTFDETVDRISVECSIDREAAFKILNVLIDNPDLLDRKTEKLYSKSADDKVAAGKSGMMIGRSTYYLSIKKVTLFTAFLLISAVSLANSEINYAAVLGSLALQIPSLPQLLNGSFKIYEESGEKCIIRELAARKQSPASAKDIKRKIGKICTKEYNCDYRINGKCTCTADDIEAVCESLAEKGALKKTGNKYVYIV